MNIDEKAKAFEIAYHDLLEDYNKMKLTSKYVAKRLGAAESLLKSVESAVYIPFFKDEYNNWKQLKEQHPQLVFAGVRLD